MNSASSSKTRARRMIRRRAREPAPFWRPCVPGDGGFRASRAPPRAFPGTAPGNRRPRTGDSRKRCLLPSRDPPFARDAATRRRRRAGRGSPDSSAARPPPARLGAAICPPTRSPPRADGPGTNPRGRLGRRRRQRAFSRSRQTSASFIASTRVRAEASSSACAAAAAACGRAPSDSRRARASASRPPDARRLRRRLRLPGDPLGSSSFSSEKRSLFLLGVDDSGALSAARPQPSRPGDRRSSALSASAARLGFCEFPARAARLPRVRRQGTFSRLKSASPPSAR